MWNSGIKGIERMAAKSKSVSTNEYPVSSPPRRRWLVARLADWGLILLLVAAIPGVWVIWNVWQPGMGESVQNMATLALGVLVVLCLIGWWLMFAPVKLRTRLAIGLPLVGLLVWGCFSIRSLEFTGHMVPKVKFRWDVDPQQQLAEHLKSVRVDTEVPLREIPAITPEDSPAYRGINRDGLVIGPPLNQDWKASPPKELWRHPSGGGYGAFSIVGDRLLSLEQRGPDEAVVCYDAATGKELWEHKYPASFFEAMGGPGPRSTPTVDGDAVYTMGAFGDVVCCELATGKRRWHLNLLQQFHEPNSMWAMTSSPLVDGGRVIVNIGGKNGNGLVALDAKTGNVLLASAGLKSQYLTTLPENERKSGGEAVDKFPPEEMSAAGYAAPQFSEVLGVRTLLNLDGDALRGHDPATLAQWWSFPFTNGAKVNVAQPIVFPDGRIFLSASYEVGCKMIQVAHEGEQWTAKELWANNNLRCKFTCAALVDGYLYGLDEGIMVCLDPATGERKWKGGRQGLKGRYDHGQILVTNGQILALTETGVALLIKPNPEKLEEITTLRVLPDTKVWNPPLLSRGKLYVRCASTEYAEMACFDLTGK